MDKVGQLINAIGINYGEAVGFSKIILKPVAFFQQIFVDNAYQVHSLKKVNSAASECRSCYSLGNVLSSDAPL